MLFTPSDKENTPCLGDQEKEEERTTRKKRVVFSPFPKNGTGLYVFFHGIFIDESVL